MERLASVINSFNKLGLDATALKKIYTFTKLAESDYSVEYSALKNVLDILKALEGKELMYFPQGLSFDPYTFKVGEKTYSYPGESLENYSKREIYKIGIRTYLKNLLDYYMSYQAKNLHGREANRYNQAVEQIKEITRTIGQILAPTEKTLEEAARDKTFTSYSLREREDPFSKAADRIFTFVDAVTNKYLQEYKFGETRFDADIQSVGTKIASEMDKIKEYQAKLKQDLLATDRHRYENLLRSSQKALEKAYRVRESLLRKKSKYQEQAQVVHQHLDNLQVGEWFEEVWRMIPQTVADTMRGDVSLEEIEERGNLSRYRESLRDPSFDPTTDLDTGIEESSETPDPDLPPDQIEPGTGLQEFRQKKEKKDLVKNRPIQVDKLQQYANQIINSGSFYVKSEGNRILEPFEILDIWRFLQRELEDAYRRLIVLIAGKIRKEKYREVPEQLDQAQKALAEQENKLIGQIEKLVRGFETV